MAIVKWSQGNRKTTSSVDVSDCVDCLTRKLLSEFHSVGITPKKRLKWQILLNIEALFYGVHAYPTLFETVAVVRLRPCFGIWLLNAICTHRDFHWSVFFKWPANNKKQNNWFIRLFLCSRWLQNRFSLNLDWIGWHISWVPGHR